MIRAISTFALLAAALAACKAPPQKAEQAAASSAPPAPAAPPHHYAFQTGDEYGYVSSAHAEAGQDTEAQKPVTVR